MKNVYLSLEDTKANQQLADLFKNDSEFNVVDSLDDKDHYTVVVNGPLTELANILMKKYDLKKNIDEVIFVGGTDCYGDVSMVGEKNVMADVKSAQSVFLSGVKVVVCGLNVTRDMANRALLPYVYLKDKSIFTTDECGVFIETKGTVCYGKMVTDIYSDAQFETHNAEMVLSINRDKYLQIVNQY